MVARHDVPPHAVDRPLLLRLLDDVLAKPLSLIVAQAGAGKTVLLSQWAASHPEVDFVWVDFALADNDPIHFARKILAGLTEADAGFAGLASLALMNGSGLGDTILDAMAERMNRLPRLVIVLDDLHHLLNRDLAADIVRLVDLSPPQVHFVLSTRVDLPFGWSRHRLRGELVEIRGSDLAFSDDESAVLLERICGRAVQPANVAVLVARTEGWVAGLQLAGMMLRYRDDTADFVAQFGGTDRLVADYLSEEVLQAQSTGRRAALLRLSLLDEMCAELVAEVTGEQDAQEFLEALERESMFLVPLDSHREWFRFHHLFRDLLRYRLRATHPAEEAVILDRAARWHLDRGDVNPAVEYLLRAKQWDAVLDLVMTRGTDVFERGEMLTVIRWISQLPVTTDQSRLDVTLLLGFLRGLEGQTVLAEDLLREVANHPHSSLGQRMVAYAVIAGRAQWSPHPEVSAEIAERALHLLEQNPDEPTPDLLRITDWSSLVTMTLFSGGRSHFLAGDLTVARRWLERALASEGAEYSVWRISALGSLALLEAWCGRTRVAEQLADEVLNAATEAHLRAHPATADAYLAATLVALERSDPKSAVPPLYEATARARSNRRTQLLWVSHLEHALLRDAEGKGVEGRDDSPPPPGGPPPAAVADRLAALGARQRRLSAASEHPLRLTGEIAAPHPAMRFERIAALLTRLQHDRARALLDAAQPVLPVEQPLVAVETLLLRAWLADSEGHVGAAQRFLDDALAIAEENELVDVFVRAGPVIVRQLALLPGPRTPFLNRVLEQAATRLAPPAAAELPEPLTYRELEILAYLPSRFTNVELAERCFVSVNTIKTHMVHIYRKLDVPNRSAAILRARELGLLR